MSNEDINGIVEQLKRLQLQQAALLTRLENLSNQGAGRNDEEHETRPPVATRDEPRAFAIGDRVGIRNPKPFQENKGTILTIGEKRTAVLSATGKKIPRAPKNLFHLKD